jgi:hypothetical protein
LFKALFGPNPHRRGFLREGAAPVRLSWAKIIRSHSRKDLRPAIQSPIRVHEDEFLFIISSSIFIGPSILMYIPLAASEWQDGTVGFCKLVVASKSRWCGEINLIGIRPTKGYRCLGLDCGVFGFPLSGNLGISRTPSGSGVPIVWLSTGVNNNEYIPLSRY